jgi:hypothetical protein
LNPFFALWQIIHLILDEYPQLKSHQWAIAVGRALLDDRIRVCSVLFRRHQSRLKLESKLVRFPITVSGRPFAYELDRRTRIGDLKQLLAARFLFPGNRVSVRFGRTEPGDHVPLSSLLALGTRGLTVPDAVSFTLRFRLTDTGAATRETLAFDATVADVRRRFPRTDGEYRFFRDPEQREELFLDPSAPLASMDVSQEITVLFELHRRIRLKLVLAPSDVLPDATIDDRATMADVLRRARAVLTAEGKFVAGFYAARVAGGSPPLPLDLTLRAQFTPEFPMVLIFVSRLTESSESALYLDSIDADEEWRDKPSLSEVRDVDKDHRTANCEGRGGSNTDTIVPARWKLRKPHDYGKQVKKLIAESGLSPRVCRQCFNFSKYDYECAREELLVFRNDHISQLESIPVQPWE